MRQPSMTTSWVAAEKATRKAPRPSSARCLRVRERHERQGRGDADLRQHHPGPPPPEPGREDRQIVPVDDRRPQELQAVGQRQIAEQPDRLDVDVGEGEPRREGAEHQQKRQPGREAERQHDRDAPVREKPPIAARSLEHRPLPRRRPNQPRQRLLNVRAAAEETVKGGDIAAVRAAAAAGPGAEPRFGAGVAPRRVFPATARRTDATPLRRRRE